MCETACEVKMDLSAMTPAEIDAAWIEALAPYYKLHAAWAKKVSKAAKYRNIGGWYAEQAKRFEADAEELRAKMVAARVEADAPFKVEWERRGGWTRAYVVPDGHIHKETSCHTLYPTTMIAWLPELSGQSEDDIVAAAGVHACTVCYPSAPVEALRAAELAAKRQGECPGSRTYEHDSSGLRYSSPRARCNHCGQVVSCTSTGKMRAHKPRES